MRSLPAAEAASSRQPPPPRPARLASEPHCLPLPPPRHAPRAPRQAGSPCPSAPPPGRRAARRAHRCKEPSDLQERLAPRAMQEPPAHLHPATRFSAAQEAVSTPSAPSHRDRSAHAQNAPRPHAIRVHTCSIECLRLSVRSPHKLPSVSLLHSPLKARPRSPRPGTSPPAPPRRLSAPRLRANPPTPPPTAASAPCRVLPARAPRAVAQRGGGSAPARCDVAVGGGQRASPTNTDLLAASCSDARLRFLPVPAQVELL